MAPILIRYKGEKVKTEVTHEPRFHLENGQNGSREGPAYLRCTSS